MSSVKLAIIRGPDVRKCPFGLKITEACHNAGNAVDEMKPSTDEKVINANKEIYLKLKNDKPCIYADKLLDNYDKVDCDYGDVGAKFHSVDLGNSPDYPRIFNTTTTPYGYYSDNNESRNLFYGLYSLIGEKISDQIIKLADKYDNDGKIDKANQLDALLIKLKDLISNGG